MAGLHAWTTAEALFISQPSIVPPNGLVQLQSALTSLQAAATSTMPFVAPQAFLTYRIGFFATLNNLFQMLFQVQIAGLGSVKRLADIAAQFASHSATVISIGNAAWNHGDLHLLAAHAHLCHVLHDTIHRFLLEPSNTAMTVRPWPGRTVDSPRAPFTPLWHFCKGLDAELPQVSVSSSIQDAAALVVDLGRAALALPCAIPRQLFRTTSVHVPSDVQIVSPALKVMSRSVIGVATHSSCHGHLHVTLDLHHARQDSPLKNYSSRSWQLVFEGKMDNGVEFTTSVGYADGVMGGGRWQGTLPLHLNAGGFGAQGTSSALTGRLWLVDETNYERWLVADRALERTVVVY
ncbi:hypothetical protein DYB32_005198 [Aphanomyces invadans]|nr:hypothetical protein DYB32_005198 [Aphanomyces invadans]